MAAHIENHNIQKRKETYKGIPEVLEKRIEEAEINGENKIQSLEEPVDKGI